MLAPLSDREHAGLVRTQPDDAHEDRAQTSSGTLRSTASSGARRGVARASAMRPTA